MFSTRSHSIALMYGVAAAACMFAAPKGQPVAAKPATPAPAIEGGEPMPENAGAIATQRATFAIEDAVPLPTKRTGTKGVSAYPFAKLAIGQSFFVPVTEKMAEPWKTLTSMSSRMTREHWPKKFVTARIPASGTTAEGVRIWRTTDGEGELPAPRVRAPKAEEAAKLPAAGADPFAGQTA